MLPAREWKKFKQSNTHVAYRTYGRDSSNNDTWIFWMEKKATRKSVEEFKGLGQREQFKKSDAADKILWTEEPF